MKFRLLILTTNCIGLLLIGCNNSSQQNDNTKINSLTIDSPKIVNSQIDDSQIDDKKNSKTGIDTAIDKNSNYELLQGKWQSEVDKTNYLVFDKNLRKEFAKGMDKWDEEEFILSDNCLNEYNKSSNNPDEKDSYITCKDSDLCWYIMSLTNNRLTLQYLGRGNTLTYIRVEK